MTKTRIRELVAELQDVMRLAHWEIETVFDEPEESGAEAWTSWSQQYDQATITLAKGWRGWDERYARRVLIHEFGHLLLRDLQMAVRTQEEFMHEQAWEQFWAWFNHEQEGVVDRYAGIIAALWAPRKKAA